jgi:hypothetical protein
MFRALVSLVLGAMLLACASGKRTGPHDPGSGAATQPADAVTLVGQDVRIERNGNTVTYRGRLTEKGFDALRQIARNRAVTALLIESVGGEIVLGMDIGNWVADRELDVVVDRACLSSCANYIFTAGRSKQILPGAVVAWHGSAKQAGLLDGLDQVTQADIESRGLSPREQRQELGRARKANMNYLTAAIHKQDRFFYRVGVDEYITRVGNEQFGVRGFFYMSVADMAVFGIENVTAPENYAVMEPRALARRVGFPVTLIRLE